MTEVERMGYRGVSIGRAEDVLLTPFRAAVGIVTSAEEAVGVALGRDPHTRAAKLVTDLNLLDLDAKVKAYDAAHPL